MVLQLHVSYTWLDNTKTANICSYKKRKIKQNTTNTNETLKMSSIETLKYFFFSPRSIEATLNCKQRHSVNDAKHPKPEPTVKKTRSLDPPEC